MAQKVGIGVSVSVGIIIVITLIAWAIILRRRNKNLSMKIVTNEVSQTQPNRTGSNDLLNLQSCEHCSTRNHELDHESMRELDDDTQIHELNHRSLCELEPATIPFELSVATPKT